MVCPRLSAESMLKVAFHMVDTWMKATFALVVVVLCHSTAEAQLPGSLFGRVSRVSNFEFTVYNDGMLWGSIDGPNGDYCRAHWPRGTTHIDQVQSVRGMLFMAKKEGRLYVSDTDFIRWRAGFSPTLNTLLIVGNQMVPG